MYILSPTRVSQCQNTYNVNRQMASTCTYFHLHENPSAKIRTTLIVRWPRHVHTFTYTSIPVPKYV